MKSSDWLRLALKSRWREQNLSACPFAVDLPELRAIPSMISPGEMRYLYSLLRTQYSGEGAAVEIGTWLGMSSSCLAAGIRDSGTKRKLICIDHFEWAGGANWGHKSGEKRERGADFLPDFLSNTAEFADIIEARRMSLKNFALPESPVEILVLDAPKRAKDISKVMSVMSGKCIPGKTILAWQDFMHAASFEIPACLAAFEAYLEPVFVVTDGSLVSFKVKKQWSEETASLENISFTRWSIVGAKTVWKRWQKIIPPPLRPSFTSGLAMLLHDLDEGDAARDVLRNVISDELTRVRWEKWRMTSLATRYQSLFEGEFASANAKKE